MNLKRSVKKRYQRIVANRALRRYKYVHLMYNEKFNKPFVDFLNKHFDEKEHLILCKRSFEYPFPDASNVIEMIDYVGLDFSHANIEKIICHSLFDIELVDLFYNNRELLNKSYWFMWGGDLYGAKRDEKNDFVRKHFKGYHSDLDKEYALQTYGMEGKFYRSFYIFPLSREMLDNTVKKQTDCVTIQINNSSDKSTLEMLDILAKFKHENIKIRTILSYSLTQYNEQIIAKGREIFGDKFEFLNKYLAPQEYAQHLAQNDILVLNQGHQEGFGNTIASLYLGVKVFIRRESSVYGYLNNDGCHIYDSMNIVNLSFDEFISNPYSSANKKETREKYYNEDYLAKLYRDFFED